VASGLMNGESNHKVSFLFFVRKDAEEYFEKKK
jgi:hypothetical protein